MEAEVFAKLAAPFGADEVEWKPQSVSGDRALAIAYIDARCVMDRLDAVAGAANWRDDYQVLDGGSVVCRLSVRLTGPDWLTKTDVGSPSDQPDAGDQMKSAFSDALKRAAVKFGIGRYLYAMPKQWVDYDRQKKQFKAAPKIPAQFLPSPPVAAKAKAPAAPAAKADAPAAPIDDPGYDKLGQMIAESGINQLTLCRRFNAGTPGEIPADRLVEALRLCEVTALLQERQIDDLEEFRKVAKVTKKPATVWDVPPDNLDVVISWLLGMPYKREAALA